jgi:hypothetical protein
VIDVQEAVTRAEAALSGASGRRVRLEKVQVLGEANRRNFIARVSAVCEGAARRSGILKATRSPSYDPAAENAFATSGLVKEYVAAAYLAAHALDRGHGSALLAAMLQTAFSSSRTLAPIFPRWSIPCSTEPRRKPSRR